MSCDVEIEAITELLDSVKDPELPVVSIVELGMVRKIAPIPGRKSVTIEITPTYSGCPAIKTMEDEIHQVLARAGYEEVTVRQVYAPAWTSDWISEAGRTKLKEYGIAPPAAGAESDGTFVLFPKPVTVACPRCSSRNTALKSQFGSTSCKALYFCQDCSQPFEYFKPL
jgi:ring-1,2-phenylacetyl-CoA epoxidase subunit PaaD